LKPYVLDTSVVIDGRIADIMLTRIIDNQLVMPQFVIAELQAKNDELDRFAATVAHNLKSPLVTIQGFLAFLEQDIARGESRRIRSDMKQIGSAVENMESLVNKRLKLSFVTGLKEPRRCRSSPPFPVFAMR